MRPPEPGDSSDTAVRKDRVRRSGSLSSREDARVADSAIPGTAGRQAPLSMGFSRQEYWSELPFPLPGVLPDPGMEAVSLRLAGGFLTREPPAKPRGDTCLTKQ